MKHSSLAEPRLKQVAKVIEKAVAEWKAIREGCEAMARKQITDEIRNAYFDSIVPGEKKRSENVRSRLTELLDHEYNRLPGMAGTLWQAYNAATYWIQYERPSRGKDDAEREDNKRYSNFLGSGSEMTATAFREAMALV